MRSVTRRFCRQSSSEHSATRSCRRSQGGRTARSWPARRSRALSCRHRVALMRGARASAYGTTSSAAGRPVLYALVALFGIALITTAKILRLGQTPDSAHADAARTPPGICFWTWARWGSRTGSATAGTFGPAFRLVSISSSRDVFPLTTTYRPLQHHRRSIITTVVYCDSRHPIVPYVASRSGRADLRIQVFFSASWQEVNVALGVDELLHTVQEVHGPHRSPGHPTCL